MSKSLGNVMAPEDLVKKYGSDATRYLLMSAVVFGNDGDISWQKFDEKYNADLANGLGNLISRVFNLIEKNYDGSVKLPGSKDALLDQSPKDLSLVGDYWRQLKIYEAIEEINEAVRWANNLIEEKKLWQLVKDDKRAGEETLAQLLSLIIDLAKQLEPLMPEISHRIISAAQADKITKGEPLFLRI